MEANRDILFLGDGKSILNNGTDLIVREVPRQRADHHPEVPVHVIAAIPDRREKLVCKCVHQHFVADMWSIGLSQNRGVCSYELKEHILRAIFSSRVGVTNGGQDRDSQNTE